MRVMKREIYDEDHEAFRASVQGVPGPRGHPHLASYADGHGLDREFWLAAGKQGFLGLEVPEEFGGSEAGDYRFNAVLTEELAKVNMTLPSCVGIHADIVAPYLVHLTDDEQKERWLPQFCTGEMVTAIGMTEPGGGSDLANLRTTAVRDGDDWILNGSKTFITNGGSADLVVVAARTAPEKKAKGITLFGVDTTLDGLHARPQSSTRSGSTRPTPPSSFFEDVRFPTQTLIGELDTRLHAHDGQAPPQERLSSGDRERRARQRSRGDLFSTPRSGTRSASRSAPSSTTASCSPSSSPGST